MKKDLNVRTEIFDVESLKVQYPHLEPIPLKKYRYGYVKTILGQDSHHHIRSLDYFETEQKNTSIAVRLPFVWSLSGPVPSSSGVFSTRFKAVTHNESNFTSADQFRIWYDMESLGAYKQVDPRFASNATGQKILEDTTYDFGCQYQVGLLWTNDKNSLPHDYFQL